MLNGHVIVGADCHLDHGKATLVKALTGTDAEKRRGFTIDLSYAYTSTLGFVDVGDHLP